MRFVSQTRQTSATDSIDSCRSANGFVRKPCSRSHSSASQCVVEAERFGVAEAVHPDRERARGGDRRVLLAERAGGGVARVRRELLAQFRDALVQLAEAGDRHVDLAAHLGDRGQAVAAHLERDRRDRAQVDGHVLALEPVAARCAARRTPSS